MRIALVSSAGGHLTEIMAVFTPEILKKRYILITENTPRTKNLPNTFFYKALRNNPFDYLLVLIKMMKLLKKQKIDIVATTGAEIGLVGIIAGRILGLKTIYIETPTRVNIPTKAGKICYPLATLFLVQNEYIGKYYGKKAIYKGGTIWYL